MANKREVGGYEFTEEADDDNLILKFPLLGHYQGGGDFKRDPVLLRQSIELAFQFYAGRHARAEKKKRERESHGVDHYVLDKIMADVQKTMSKYDRRTLRAAASLRDAVMSFEKGDRVRVDEKIKEVGGKEGVVTARRQKCLVVKIGENSWRCPPSILKKVA